MIKTLTKHGNSMALVIEKPVLELLNIGPETPLDITTDGHSLVVTPAEDGKYMDKVQAALKRGNKKYSRALKNLAQ